MTKEKPNDKLKEEFTQVYLRYFIIIFTAICLMIISPSLFDRYFEDYLSLRDIFILGFLSNIVFHIIIRFAPTFLPDLRIYIESFIDISLTSLAMVTLGAYSVYFPALLLWFIVGYSSRYDIKVAIFVTTNTFLAWLFIIYLSDYWPYHIDAAIGWMLSFLILPLYFIKVLIKLNTRYLKLYQNLNETQEDAKYDFLTNLINRSYFEKTLDDFIAKSLKSNMKFALIFIDLDGFKKVNDILGHDVGDEVLIEAANRLRVVKKREIS